MGAAKQYAERDQLGPADDTSSRLAVFDARLAERTGVPISREWALDDLDHTELDRQAASARRMLDRIAAVVAAAHSEAGVVRGFLARLDLKLVSRDHQWREVFRALSCAPPGSEPYQRVALARYRQYLESRVALTARLLAQREALQETAGVGERHDVGVQRVRLPARRPVLLQLPYRDELVLWFGGHRFVVRDGFPPELVDPNGEMRWPLARHALTVGRHPENDLVVDARFDRVSRAHAMLEWPGHTRIIVVDLSSGGTFVEKKTRH